eukprot:TRINITY_DN1975_c0_g1_i3.p1 TRINITY_DN1975_c0_g1~~TRINITY_DN1975_c0_g1_i3.p1  ORF type:complete len:224 (+),score=31.94 TRINITY_DN1975_c0_g1_i3:666-1337(+)
MFRPAPAACLGTGSSCPVVDAIPLFSTVCIASRRVIVVPGSSPLIVSRSGPPLHTLMSTCTHSYSDNFKSSQQTGLFSDSSGEPMDDEDDEDYSNKRSSKKKKSMSSAAGASKRARKVAAVVSSNPHYYTQPELVSLLSKICGAISSSTSKLCSHSLRCPQHSDVQRSVSRTRLLAGSSLNELESTITVQKHTLKVLVKEAGTAAGTSAAPDAMEIQSDILEI